MRTSREDARLPMPSTTPPARASNRFLAALSPQDWEAVSAMLVPIDLPQGAELQPFGATAESIFVPASGIVSLMAELADGARVEVGLVGAESLVGLRGLLGEERASTRAIVQVPGRGYQIPLAAFRPLWNTRDRLRDLVSRHIAAAMLHATINAACNAVHTLERRTARWLLSVEDRVGPTFPITQEYLGIMIAARRPVVNGVLNRFRRAGLIDHGRGRISVTDRPGLEAMACVCYGAERQARESLLVDNPAASTPARPDSNRPKLLGIIRKT
jgi:CRP-like cAMP-binding protein